MSIKTIEIYGQHYAANDSGVIGSLFKPVNRKTANGTFQIKPEGIYLKSLNGKHTAFIRKDGLGPVSVSSHKGRKVYAYALSSLDERWLGVPKSYLEHVRGAETLAKQVYNGG